MKNCIFIILIFVSLVLGCSGLKDGPDWTKAKKIAGKDQKLSHISGMVVDDKFAYVSMGGTLADQNEGMSGLRKVSLENGAVTMIDDGIKNLPQSDYGGMAVDDKYLYWNAGGNILRAAKEGGKQEVVASENVGVGIDIAVDNDKVYWANHGYYSPGQTTAPKPIYAVAKSGGKPEIFADAQDIPHCIVADEKNVYWLTTTSVMKKSKSGGEPQAIYKADDSEGVDELSQDADNLYFGFRSKGNSRWGLRKVAKSGGEPVTLVKTYSLKPVAVDEANVYFFDENSMNKDALCKVSKNGGEVTRLDVGYASGVIAQSKTLVFFAAMDDIYSFQK